MLASAAGVNIVSLATIMGPTMPQGFDLSSFLPYRLAVLAERVSRRLAEDYGRSHGLSVAEWRVLAHLARSGSVSVRDIHARAALEKPRVSRAVARLEAAGLVAKAAGAGDGRLVAISLTGKGARVLAEILPSALAVEERLRAAVGPDDMAALLRAMDRFHAALDRDAG
ncbi:MAG TPA: MarR family winged helix-turn-helix transcriptional regulator [Paracoccaceae bacterium]|nr:MarR family winged helix-turn-helix transcriptional regulator [Paracoccaceae bacterium]